MNEQLYLFLLANRVVFVKAGLLMLNSYFSCCFWCSCNNQFFSDMAL